MEYSSSVSSVILSIFCIFLNCSSPGTVKEKNTLKPFENVSMEELKLMMESGNITKPRINIRGTVKQRFICPSCPDGVDCEQCPPDYIVVSDGKNSIMITCRPDNFMEDEEYCFSLEIKKYTNGFPFNITGWERKPGRDCMPCRQGSN